MTKSKPKLVEFVVADFLNWKAYMHTTAAVTSWVYPDSVALRLQGLNIAFMFKNCPDILFVRYSDFPLWKPIMYLLNVPEETIQLCKKTRVVVSIPLHRTANLSDPEVLL